MRDQGERWTYLPKASKSDGFFIEHRLVTLHPYQPGRYTSDYQFGAPYDPNFPRSSTDGYAHARAIGFSSFFLSRGSAVNQLDADTVFADPVKPGAFEFAKFAFDFFCVFADPARFGGATVSRNDDKN